MKFYLQTVETVFPFLIITTFLLKIGDSISGKLQFSNRKITRSADAWGRKNQNWSLSSI